MTAEKIKEYRRLAEKHRRSHKSAQIILECLDDIEELQRLYCIALDAAYKQGRSRGIAINRLKALATKESANGK